MNESNYFKTLVLFGSTSDIGLEVVRQITQISPWNVLLVGRSKPDLTYFDTKLIQINFIHCDFLDFQETKNSVDEIFSTYSPDLALIAAAVLPAENSHLDEDVVSNTFDLNSSAMIRLLSKVAAKFCERKSGEILVFSSVAGVRPRLKNFTYGASKAALDFFAYGLANSLHRQGVKIKIFRIGFVFTQLTQNFSPAPFALSKKAVARIIITKLGKRGIIYYVPKKLRVIFFVLRMLPWKLFSKLD